MAITTLKHPDVQIREFDLSLGATTPSDTVCLIMGFANSGEDLVVNDISTIQSFINYYGSPTNDAETYFYEAVRDVLSQNGAVVAAKLPYDNNSYGKYRATGFEIQNDRVLLSSSIISSVVVAPLFGETLSASARLAQIVPTTSGAFDLTNAEVESLRSGQSFTESLAGDLENQSIVVIDKSRSRITGNLERTGIFTVLLPMYNAIAVQSLYALSSGIPTADYRTYLLSAGWQEELPYENWQLFGGISSYTGATATVASAYTDPVYYSGTTPPVAPFYESSISKNLAYQFPVITRDTNGNIDKAFTDQVAVLVCRAYADPQRDDKLSINVLEQFTGTFNINGVDPTTGLTTFLPTLINGISEYIELYFNAAHASRIINTNSEAAMYSIVTNAEKNTKLASTVVWPLMSFTQGQTAKTVSWSKLVAGVDSILEDVKDIDARQIDVVLDAGVTSIAQYAYYSSPTAVAYEPQNYSQNRDNITSSASVYGWKTISSKLNAFSQNTRKDCMTVIDAPRSLSLKGNIRTVRPTSNTSVDIEIIPKLQYLSGINSSYTAMYTPWLKIINSTGTPTWIPMSCRVGGLYCFTDNTFNYWEAPAGLERGILNSIVDISMNLDSANADIMYERSFNYAKQYPYEGFTVEGQRTLLFKASAFRSINVRRAFLRLERFTYKVARYFVYQINNYYNRTRLVDLLTPYFEEVRSKGGINDYQIVCDETNNTASVIENQELKVAILIKPAISAEKILCDFIATKQDANFEEVILP